MSAASERARALLAKASGGWRRIASVDPLLFDDGEPVDLFGDRPTRLGTVMEPTDADLVLIAAACSPEGGILATLAGEVEAFEALPQQAWVDKMAAEVEDAPIVREARERFADAAARIEEKHAALTAENARLRKALEGARRRHTWDCPAYYEEAGLCGCGATAHNARIDAALKGSGG